MSRFQPRQLAPFDDKPVQASDTTPAGTPPGENITFPEVSWPEQLPEPPPVQRERSRDVPLVVEMIEPEPDRLTPVLFWLIIIVCFACVLARSAGWL